MNGPRHDCGEPEPILLTRGAWTSVVRLGASCRLLVNLSPLDVPLGKPPRHAIHSNLPPLLSFAMRRQVVLALFWPEKAEN